MPAAKSPRGGKTGAHASRSKVVHCIPVYISRCKKRVVRGNDANFLPAKCCFGKIPQLAVMLLPLLLARLVSSAAERGQQNIPADGERPGHCMSRRRLKFIPCMPQGGRERRQAALSLPKGIVLWSPSALAVLGMAMVMLPVGPLPMLFRAIGPTL